MMTVHGTVFSVFLAKNTVFSVFLAIIKKIKLQFYNKFNQRNKHFN